VSGNRERFQVSDYRFIGFCILACLIAIPLIAHLFPRAFPEAALELKVNKGQSQEIAQKTLANFAIDYAGFKHASVFGYDQQAKIFLERELGLEGANKVLSEEVDIWYWQHRWFKPLEKTEYRVGVNPAGKIVYFSRTLPDEAAGETLSPEVSLGLAQDFITNNLKYSPDELTFLEQSTTKHPQRRDHSITFRFQGKEYQQAQYRLQITLQGGEIGGFRHYLHIPEQWQREYGKLRSLNNTTADVAYLFIFLIGLAMLATFVQKMRYGDIRWRVPLILGITAAVLTLLSQANSFSLTLYGYNTTESYESFIASHLFMGIVQALMTGGFILGMVVSAEPLYREKFPQAIALTSIFRWKGMQTKYFFTSVLLGLTLTLFLWLINVYLV